MYWPLHATLWLRQDRALRHCFSYFVLTRTQWRWMRRKRLSFPSHLIGWADSLSPLSLLQLGPNERTSVSWSLRWIKMIAVRQTLCSLKFSSALPCCSQYFSVQGKIATSRPPLANLWEGPLPLLDLLSPSLCWRKNPLRGEQVITPEWAPAL